MPAILMALLIFLVVIILFYLLINKTDVLIKLLQLDKGFDNEIIEFNNFALDNILKLGVIIIVGTMILDNIAVFLN